MKDQDEDQDDDLLTPISLDLSDTTIPAIVPKPLAIGFTAMPLPLTADDFDTPDDFKKPEETKDATSQPSSNFGLSCGFKLSGGRLLLPGPFISKADLEWLKQPS